MYDREDYEEFIKGQINDIFGPEPTPEEREADELQKRKAKRR